MMDKLGDRKMMQIAMKNFHSLLITKIPIISNRTQFVELQINLPQATLLPTTPHHRHLTQSDF